MSINNFKKVYNTLFIIMIVFFFADNIFLIFLQNIYLITVLSILFIILIALLPSAFITLAERQVVGTLQQRLGPYFSGSIFGIIQPIFNGLKLFLRNLNKVNKNNQNMLSTINYIPIFIFSLTIAIWCIIPLKFTIENNFLILILALILTITPYPLLLLSFKIKNKYNILGVLRIVVLIISYDICMGLIILPLFLFSGNLSLTNFYNIELIKIIIFFLIQIILFYFVICMEGMKVPFDVVESEGELASSYLLEYSSLNFALIVISEYISFFFLIIVIQKIVLTNINFFITIFFVFIFLIFRTMLPNYKFNYIMIIFWKYLFPISLILYILNILLFYI